jgi:hypothetical protein
VFVFQTHYRSLGKNAGAVALTTVLLRNPVATLSGGILGSFPLTAPTPAPLPHGTTNPRREPPLRSAAGTGTNWLGKKDHFCFYVFVPVSISVGFPVSDFVL